MHRLACLTALVLLAGCSQAPPAPEPEPPAATQQRFAMTWPLAIECPASCYEPTVAVDPTGAVFVTVANAGSIAIRNADGNWTSAPPPPLPPGAPSFGTARGDGTLSVDPQGRLWYLSLVLTGTGIGAQALVFLGIQVARSDDQAATWAVNTFLSPAGPAPIPLAQAERPWLAFAADRVYLAYPHWVATVGAGGVLVGVPDGLMVTTSTDDGATFANPVRAARPTDLYAIPGRPVVQPDGTLLVPYSGGDGRTSAYVLAVSDDAGATFEQRVVATQGGVRFPALGQDANGTLWASWLVAGTIQLATSADGLQWSEARAMNDAASPPGPSPRLEPAPGGGMVLSWSEGANQPVLHWFGDSQSDGDRLEGVVANGTAYTDFVDFTFAPDGSLWIPSADPDAGVFVTRLSGYS